MMHLEIFIGAVAKEFGATRPEVREAGYVLLGRQGGCLMEVDGAHLWFPGAAGGMLSCRERWPGYHHRSNR